MRNSAALLRPLIDDIVGSDASEGTRLQRLCDLVRREVDRFSWVGFYLAYEETKELLLGPFSGAPTEHTVIPYGRGVCGRAAEERRSIIVEDVSSEANYLACSISTRSEAVLPLFYDDGFIGVLDIDSDARGAFDPDQIDLLQTVAHVTPPLVAAILPST